MRKPSLPQLLLVAHSDARTVLPKLPGALRGFPQSTRSRAVRQRLCEAVFREILTGCETGRPVKQAPRFPVGLLALVEKFVMKVSNPACMRMYSWRVLLQSWSTMRFSDHRRLSPESARTRPEGYRLGEQETMIQLDEYLTKKEHDNVVAKITKKIGEWGPRETAGETAALTQGNLEDETEENRGLGAEGYRGLIPAGSELPEPDPEESSEVDTLERPDKRHRAEKIKKLGGTPQQRREQIRASSVAR